MIANHRDIVVPAALQGLGITYAYNDDGIAEAGRSPEAGVGGLIAKGAWPVEDYSSRRWMLPALCPFIGRLLDHELDRWAHDRTQWYAARGERVASA